MENTTRRHPLADTSGRRERVFSYRTIRGLVGLIALGIGGVAAWISGGELGSISASYHTDAQDLFVGSLFIVSAFLGAYRGSPYPEHTQRVEFAAAKTGSFAVFLVAIFPTQIVTSDGAGTESAPEYALEFAASIGTTPSTIHGGAAIAFFVMLFLIMAVFSMRAFAKPKGACRAVAYALCSFGMAASVLLVVVSDERGVFWAEFAALGFFGIGWLYSGVYEVLGKQAWWPACPRWLVGHQESLQQRFGLRRSG